LIDRIENLIAAGRLQHSAAPDEEVIGLWGNALKAFGDATLASQSLRGRLTDAYDAGRLAAHAIVRCHGLRVRAANHHEMTIATAALLTGSPLSQALNRLQGTRTMRVEIEYGWGNVVNPHEVDSATSIVREILQEGARHIRAQRETVKRRIKLPK
jgi:hypothetical protein